MEIGHSSHARYYECPACETRVAPASYRATCPRCDGPLVNIGTPRE